MNPEQQPNYLVILSCSRYGHGYHVAGKRIERQPDGRWSSLGQWVRLVAGPRPDDISLAADKIGYGNLTQRPEIGDIIIEPEGQPFSLPGMPENRIVQQEPWQFVAKAPANLLASLEDQPEHLWRYDPWDSRTVSREHIQQGRVTQSLYLIKPHQLQWELEHTLDRCADKPRHVIRASFSYRDGQHTRLSAHCRQLLQRMEHQQQFPRLGAPARTMESNEPVLICLSLTDPFQATDYRYIRIESVINTTPQRMPLLSPEATPTDQPGVYTPE